MSRAISTVSNYIAWNVDSLLALVRSNPALARNFAITASLVAFRAVVSLVKKHVPKHTVLEIDLDHKIREHPQRISLFDKNYSLQEVVDTIELAASDSRVVAICMKVKASVALSLAQLQELRSSIERFKAAGKLTVIYTETFGELSNSIGTYYLASVFNLIYIQQSGAVCLAGPSGDAPFIKNTLSKIGITSELSHRKRYKTMANLFNEEKLTPEHREMIESIGSDQFAQIVDGIATGRKLSEDLVKAKFLRGIHSSSDALDGLVDGARYQDEVYKAVLDNLKTKANFLFWHKYRAKTGGKYGKGKAKNTIALIYATGNIHRGQNSHNDFNDNRPSIGSESLTAVIRTATRDKKVKAIVLRVDSGGGSYVASDTIYHELLAAKNAGKKIVVSMGNVAASGGYFISMAADQIVAQPGTLTGSIGVVYGKMVTKAMWEKLGVTHDNVKIPVSEDESGIYNDFFSTLHSYEKNPEYIKKREEVLDYIYDDFTKKVAFSRKLNREQVEAAAQGRVWTGRQALERGLVDKLGGLEEAIHTARALAGIPITTTPFVEVYPKHSFKNLIISPKNREESDSSAQVNMQSFAGVMDGVSLFSSIAGSAASLINTQFPNLQSETLSASISPAVNSFL